MILTPLNIQIAIIKAWYSIALKSIKYYGGLAVGKNNSCLLKEARLLRKYVEILRNFKIVGSTITCSCCLEGSYTFLLNDLSEATESQIQFNCDNTGYLYFNNVGYPFTYIYDADNKKLLIECNVDSFEFTMNLLDVTFDENCNVLNTNDLVTPNAGSPLESATIEVTGTPITVENEYGNWSGTLEVRDDAGDPSYTLTIPAGLLSDPQAIVDLWNTTYGNTGWLLYYNGTSYIMTTPLENNEFFVDYTVVFNQYEGGSDPGPQPPFRTLRFDTTLLTPLLPSNGRVTFGVAQPFGTIIYDDLVAQPYNSVQDIIDTLNENTEFQFSLNINVSPFYEYINVLAPINSFAYFNGPDLSFRQEIIPLGITDPLIPGSNNYTITIPDITEYIVGEIYVIGFSEDNDYPGNTTLNINNLGPITIYSNGFPINPGFITLLLLTSFNIKLEYDGTNFIVLQDSWERFKTFLPAGVNPTQEEYKSAFEVNGNVGTFENNDSCEPTVAEQECLTNNDVVNIIRHIDRIVK